MSDNINHACQMQDMKLIAERENPIVKSWPHWTLWGCTICGKLKENQAHSEEDPKWLVFLSIWANATNEYVHHMYKLNPDQSRQLVDENKDKKLGRTRP